MKDICHHTAANNKLNSQYKAALNLVVKACKDKDNLDSKWKTQNIIKQMLQSGNLRPAEIADKGHLIRTMQAIDCEICSNQCWSLREFMSHMKDDHPGGKLKCSYCDKTFSSWSGRYKHEQEHDSSTATIICMICGRAFHFKNELEKHMSVHNDDLRHVCATFAQKGAWNVMTQFIKI